MHGHRMLLQLHIYAGCLTAWWEHGWVCQGPGSDELWCSFYIPCRTFACAPPVGRTCALMCTSTTRGEWGRPRFKSAAAAFP